MSETVELFDENAFIKDFIHKLEKLLKKAPIQVQAKIISPKVELSILGFDTPLVFHLIFKHGVRENIFHLKNTLYAKYYPIIEFITEIKEKYSSIELENMIKKGLSLSEALKKQKTIIFKESYKISRVIIKKDHLFLKKIEDSSDERLYQLTMPLSIFLKRMREKWSQEETNKMFQEHAVFVRIIYPSKVWKSINEEKEKTLVMLTEKEITKNEK